MKSFLPILSILFCSLNACSQSNIQPNKQQQSDLKVGGQCEGCEAVFECPVPFNKLTWIDTLPDFSSKGPGLVISGIVYAADGKPAKDIVLYIYHTDQQGNYSNRNNEKGWAARHGYIRGWMKTNDKGAYKFYTLLPASYPNSKALKHIHPVIKEPGKTAYWIDEYIFDNDPFLTQSELIKVPLHGGSGLIKLKQKDGMLVGERNIYLGKNIPGYPK